MYLGKNFKVYQHVFFNLMLSMYVVPNKCEVEKFFPRIDIRATLLSGTLEYAHTYSWVSIKRRVLLSV